MAVVTGLARDASSEAGMALGYGVRQHSGNTPERKKARAGLPSSSSSHGDDGEGARRPELS
ncbi:hypothetical protein E2562_031008 [Oryza meyeriana var. granulata]|uniref:Uncharacterized protein n=1 Tax=Oryza meyeriana var. granulata TaxID=110450 RepID=A0A6G1ERF3_9ORYZ|nr:hypothetical protein E2562_031008 [Oryza meyeriana var. granulata]